jgi:hypothetical protein
MVVFMKLFSEFLSESILDPEQATLSQSVFDLQDDNKPKLKASVRDQILSGLSRISAESNVLDYTLIGSILTRRYAPDADVDVNVLISAENQDQYDSAKSAAIASSGKLVSGTKHPINYHVLSDKKDFDNANDSADGVFDISKNEFVRKPINKPFHVEKYFSTFKAIAAKIDTLKDDLRDDLIDYSTLKSFSKHDAQTLKKMIEDELEQIEQDAQGLSALHDKIVADRNAGFAKPISAKDIREYGTKNRLPGNVVYKLLERYHYLTFLKQVDSVLEDGKVTDSEADKLLDIVR